MGRIELPSPPYQRGILTIILHGIKWSGWQDLNLRPPAPKAGALIRLSYTQVNLIIGRLGEVIETIKLRIHTKP